MSAPAEITSVYLQSEVLTARGWRPYERFPIDAPRAARDAVNAYPAQARLVRVELAEIRTQQERAA
jgi:hypothetical protein